MAIGDHADPYMHPICDVDWFARQPTRRPVRVRATDADGNIHPTDYRSEPCCYCGQPTRGIYVRARASEVHRR